MHTNTTSYENEIRHPTNTRQQQEMVTHMWTMSIITNVVREERGKNGPILTA